MKPELAEMRVVVVGTSGAGKTTFADALAAALQLQHTELDQLHWGPGWTPAPTEQFVRATAQAAAGQRWVMDGNYSVVRDMTTALAARGVVEGGSGMARVECSERRERRFPNRAKKLRRFFSSTGSSSSLLPGACPGARG